MQREEQEEIRKLESDNNSHWAISEDQELQSLILARPAPFYHIGPRCSSEHRSWWWHRMERYRFPRSLESLWPHLEPGHKIEYSTAGKYTQPKCQLTSIYDYTKDVNSPTEYFLYVSHHCSPTRFDFTYRRIRAKKNPQRRQYQRKRNWFLVQFDEYRCPSSASVLLLRADPRLE